MAMMKEMATPSYGLDAVNISFPKDSRGKLLPLPLVISPRWDASLDFLVAWCERNRPYLSDLVTARYGAVLLRGFDVFTAADVERAVQAYHPTLSDVYRGTSPRRCMEGTRYVFSAAEVPNSYPIAQHLEMSFLPAPPTQLFFACLRPSALPGGETALADFQQVCADLPLPLKQKFLERGIRYTRTHRRSKAWGANLFTWDVAAMLTWPELFGTTDRAEVERICAAEGIASTVEWTADGSFVSTAQSAAFRLHPATGAPVWFNHTQVFHWTTFAAELWFAWTRNPLREWRALLRCAVVAVLSVLKYGLLGHTMSLHATFGDGAEISAAEMAAVRRAVHARTVTGHGWERGDVLLLDNLRVSHGRQPTRDQNRKIVVAWSADAATKTDAVTTFGGGEPTPSLAAAAAKAAATAANSNPQERTPESTLTKEESASLQQNLQLLQQLDGSSGLRL